MLLVAPNFIAADKTSRKSPKSAGKSVLRCHELRETARNGGTGTAIDEFQVVRPIFVVAPNLISADKISRKSSESPVRSILRGHKPCEIGRVGAYFDHLWANRKRRRTRWRSGVDSNPRCREGFYGRNSARVCRTTRPDKKHPCWREFVRLGFGSASALSVSLRSPAPSPMLGDVGHDRARPSICGTTALAAERSARRTP